MSKDEIKDLLFEICEDKDVYKDDIDLVESGLIDSFAFIELFTRFEDLGYDLQPTRIDRSKLRTVDGIFELLNEYKNN